VINAGSEAIAALIAKARAKERLALDEVDGKQVLKIYDIDVPKSVFVNGIDDVASVIAPLKPPLVVKVVSPDVLHKSDAGGVAINLRSVADVERAITIMSETPQLKGKSIDGWLIEEMAPAGQEIVIGGVRDPDFGPLVMVGLGGIFVEVLADVSFRICPITRLDASEMISELQGSALLKGIRGAKPVSHEAIVNTLLKVGGPNGLLIQHSGDFKEVDINPLIVSGHGAVAVDARFILA